MTTMQRLISLTIFFSTLFFTQTALALQFTYTSQALEFKQGYLGGQPDDYVGTYDPPTPIFNISFVGTANGLTTKLLFGDISVNERDDTYQFDNVASSQNSRITLNQDGSIASWNFTFGLFIKTPQTIDSPMGQDAWLFQSSYGANTCNCDVYRRSFDIYTPRPYFTWQYVNRIGLFYGGENSFSNWTIENANTEIPEPASYLLLCFGLIMVGVTRLCKTLK